MLAKQVLSWLSCARRPLVTSEIQMALAVEKDTSQIDKENLPRVEDLVSACAGLVMFDYRSDIVRLVHYTTKDYLDLVMDKWYPDAQKDITTVCLTYLSFEIFESGFAPTDDDFNKRLLLHPLYDYVSRNWGYHASLTSKVDEQLALKFLQNENKFVASS